MSRRSLAAFAVGAVLMASLTACSTSDSTTDAASTPAACDLNSLPLVKDGTLTIGTDKPAYPPYFEDDDPTNGKGFESAVAYAVAEELGFDKSKVTWVTVPFNASYAPGEKKFDFDINQISVTPEREKAVTFSAPYYSAPQALVALEGTDAAKATTFEDLKDVKVGVQVGTTSLQFVDSVIAPTAAVQVFNDTAAATSALKNKQIDAIVVDLPTASYITEVELDNGVLVGQFPETDGSDWGLLLAKDSALTACVDQAIEAISKNGTLKNIQDDWLPFLDVPEIKQ